MSGCFDLTTRYVDYIAMVDVSDYAITAMSWMTTMETILLRHCIQLDIVGTPLHDRVVPSFFRTMFIGEAYSNI